MSKNGDFLPPPPLPSPPSPPSPLFSYCCARWISVAKGKGSSLITSLSAKARQLAIKTGAKAKAGKETAGPVVASAVTKAYAASLLATMKLKTFAQAQRQKRSNKALVEKAKVR